jgi:hypothetical protein
VSDDGGIGTRRAGRLHLVWVHEGPVEPADHITHERRARPHPDEEHDADRHEYEREADDERGDQSPHGNPPIFLTS